MTTVYLDPVAMDATAGAVGEHAREIEVVAADLESACSADVPLALAGWLAEELRDVAVHAQMVALVYAVAALDTALRAQQIQADQSLVTAQPALGPPLGQVDTMGDLGAILAGAAVVGGTDPFPTSSPSLGTTTIGGFSPLLSSSTGPFTTTIGGFSPLHSGSIALGPTVVGAPSYAHFPLVGMLGGTGGGGFVDPMETQNNHIKNLLAPTGTSFVDGQYEDRSGRRGDLSSVYRNPDRPGEYEVG